MRGYQAGRTPADQLKPPPPGMRSPQVSTADVAREAIDRLQAELEQLRGQVLEVIAGCDKNWKGNPNADQAIAYRVVGDKLREIVG